MISNSKDLPIVALSVRLYQRLLVAYPTKFQQKYGSDMVDVFRSCCLRAVRQGGMNGMAKLWVVTILDLLQSVISEYSQKEVEMKREMKPEDIRMAGRALIWGAVVFIISILLVALGVSAHWGLVVLTQILSLPLLVFGLWGVRNHYGDKVGRVGKYILGVGTILGPLITFIGFFGVTYSFESLAILFLIGPAVLFACLTLFGFVALYKKPLPRWNMVPLLAGIWYPIFTLAYVITSINTGNWDGDSAISIPAVVSIILCIIQGIALAALGYILKSDVPAEIAIPA